MKRQDKQGTTPPKPDLIICKNCGVYSDKQKRYGHSKYEYSRMYLDCPVCGEEIK